MCRKTIWNNASGDAIFHKSNMDMDFTTIQYQESRYIALEHEGEFLL